MIGPEAAIRQLTQALSEGAAACRNLLSLPFPTVYSAAIGIRYVVLSRRSGITPALLSRKQFKDTVDKFASSSPISLSDGYNYPCFVIGYLMSRSDVYESCQRSNIPKNTRTFMSLVRQLFCDLFQSESLPAEVTLIPPASLNLTFEEIEILRGDHIVTIGGLISVPKSWFPSQPSQPQSVGEEVRPPSITGHYNLFASPQPVPPLRNAPPALPFDARIAADLALTVTPADLYPVVWYATSLFLSLEGRSSIAVSIAVGIYTGVYFKVARPYQLDVCSFELPICMLGLKAEAFRLGFLVTRDVSVSLGESDIANIARNIASACHLYCLLFPDNWNNYLMGSFAAQILYASGSVVLPTADCISMLFPSPYPQFTIIDPKDPVRLSGEIRSAFGDIVAIGRAALPSSDAPSVESQISALSAEIEYGIQLDSALYQASQAFSQP